MATKQMTIKYHKNEEGQFVCPHCNSVKKNQSTMHYHMKKHEEQVTHVCKLCKKGFLQRQTLELHMRSRHEKDLDKKFKCTFCEFSSLTKGNCVVHFLRTHYQEETDNVMDKDGKTVNCTKCEKNFNSLSSFYYHCKECIDFENDDKYKKFEQLM